MPMARSKAAISTRLPGQSPRTSCECIEGRVEKNRRTQQATESSSNNELMLSKETRSRPPLYWTVRYGTGLYCLIASILINRKPWRDFRDTDPIFSYLFPTEDRIAFPVIRLWSPLQWLEGSVERSRHRGPCRIRRPTRSDCHKAHAVLNISTGVPPSPQG